MGAEEVGSSSDAVPTIAMWSPQLDGYRMPGRECGVSRGDVMKVVPRLLIDKGMTRGLTCLRFFFQLLVSIRALPWFWFCCCLYAFTGLNSFVPFWRLGSLSHGGWSFFYPFSGPQIPLWFSD